MLGGWRGVIITHEQILMGMHFVIASPCVCPTFSWLTGLLKLNVCYLSHVCASH